MNIYLVESPFQLLGAIEASCSMGAGDRNLIIVRYTSLANTNSQMDLILTKFSVTDVFKIQYGANRLHSHFLILKRLFLCIFAKYQVANIFIGDFRSLWMHGFANMLSVERLFLLDDGNATLKFQRDRISQRQFLPEKEGFKGNLEAIVYGLFIRKPDKPPNLFTIFKITPVKDQGLVRHQFSAIRNSEKKHYKTIESTVFFFGGKYSEEKILDINYEVKLVCAARDYYEKLGFVFVYIPHRGESELKLKILASNNIPVKKINLPCEIFLLMSDELPKKIASFYSTILSTLPLFLRFESIDSFVIEKNKIADMHRYAITKCYENLQDDGHVNFISLEGI